MSIDKAKHSVKKSLLRDIVKKKTLKGASPLKMDGGLGKTPLKTSDIGSGGGSNLGTNGVF